MGLGEVLVLVLGHLDVGATEELEVEVCLEGDGASFGKNFEEGRCRVATVLLVMVVRAVVLVAFFPVPTLVNLIVVWVVLLFLPPVALVASVL